MSMFVNRIPDEEQSCIFGCISSLEAADRILLDTLFVCSTGSDECRPDGAYDLIGLKNQIEKDIETLKKRTLNLAVCGLEKSGKTSLIAGLVGDFKLPFSHKADIRYECGETDGCELHFYTYQEFCALLKNMLQSVGFDGPEDSFAEMEGELLLEVFENYRKSLEKDNPELYARCKHTVAEIKNIIILKEDIKKCLGGNESYAAENRRLDSINFDIADVSGIDGIEKFDVYKRTSAARAYALKEAVIKLKALKDISGCGSIEELAGFDSHDFRLETRNRLSSADIVILNWNIAASCLPLSVLEIFAEVRDLYGLALKNKTLVFGNNTDRIANSDYLDYYKKRIRRDFADYNIAEPDNIIFGSDPEPVSESEAENGRVSPEAAPDSLGTSADSGAEKVGEASEAGGLSELCRKIYPVYCRNVEGKLRAALQKTEEIIVRLLKELDGVDDSRSGLGGFLGRRTEPAENVSEIRRLICTNKKQRFKGILEDISRFRAEYRQAPENAEEAQISAEPSENRSEKKGIADFLAEKLKMEKPSFLED